MKNKKISMLLLLMAGAIVVFIFVIIGFTGEEKQKDVVTVGFVMSGSKDEMGWNGRHYEGIVAACEEMGAELIVKENIEEYSGQCLTAIDELVAEGADMIILSSYGYSEEAVDKVKEYPEVPFYGNSSEYHDTNLTSYFIRLYQARYLAGVLAGMQTECDAIGYVAAMPNNEVNRGISAFTLGVQSVNPEARVVVAWTGSWSDEAKEKEMARALIEKEKVDVLTYHQNLPYVVEVAEEYGIYSIGYHEAEQSFSDKYLTAVVCNWDMVYQELIRAYIKGKENDVRNYWLGMEANAVELSEYSSEVSEEAKKEIENVRAKFDGRFQIFSGLLYDMEGNKRCDENETIGDEVLLEQFDWYVKGVEFYEE